MSIKPSSKGVVAVDVSIVLLNPAPGVELKGLQVKVVVIAGVNTRLFIKSL